MTATATPISYDPARTIRTIQGRARTFLGGTANVESTLASGHTWVFAGQDASSSLNFADTSAPNGSQCIKMVTKGDGTTTQVTNPRIAAPVSMVGKALVLQLKIDAANYQHLTSLTVYTGGGASAFTNFYNQSVHQYNGTTSDYAETAAPGEWFTIAMPVAAFRGSTGGTPDFTAIKDIRVKAVDDNTGNKSTVYIGGCWFAAQDTTTYPNGVVTLCFDDLFSHAYTAALPKLAQYGYRGSVFAIRDTIDTAGYMATAQMLALRDAGWEVCAHAGYVANHNQADGDALMASGALEADWVALRSYLNGLGMRGSGVFAWPQGKFTATTFAAGKKWYSAMRLANIRTVESVPPADPWRIHAIAPSSTTVFSPNSTVGSMQWLVDQVVANGGWLVCVFHKVVSVIGSQPTIECLSSDFNAFIDYLNTKGVTVATMSEVLGL